MQEPVKVKSIDQFLIGLFSSLDPYQVIPDENSHTPDRSRQFKAPDHFLFDRRVLVERKSLNPDHSTFIGRVNATTKEQGEEFIILGQVEIESIWRDLADPIRARRRFSQKSLRSFEKCMNDARDKFSQHAKATGIAAACRILVVSEEGEGVLSDGRLNEWAMGKYLTQQSNRKDRTGVIDSILYIRDPADTISGNRGHWFKWVTREKATLEQRRDASAFGATVHDALARHFISLGKQLSKFGDPVELLA